MEWCTDNSINVMFLMLVGWVVGFLSGKFPQESRNDIKRIKKTTNEMYWMKIQDRNNK